ncbi:MAG: aldo/keto reductase [Rubrivivax sp.]
MRYKSLGRTGLFVSELCLGTMTFGGGSGIWSQIGGLQQAEAERLVGQAIDAGVNFIDTADVYSGGLSEQITGQALKNLKVPRDQVVVATKVFGETGSGPNQRGASRSHLLAAVRASLERLHLDHIDLYLIHGFDPATPIEETLRALDTLVQHGHVRHVGVSNWAAWQIAKALGISERLGLARLESLQAYYTLAGRDLERELVPMLASEGLGLMVWSPLAGGLLSGKFQTQAGANEAGKGKGKGKGKGSGQGKGQDEGRGPSNGAEAGSRRSSFDFPPVDPPRADACIDAMRPIAAAHGVSVAQVALSWLLHQPVVTSVIVGAKRPEQLAENLACVDLQLSADDLSALDEASRLPAEYPGWMLERQGGHRRQQLVDAAAPVVHAAAPPTAD